MTGKVLGACTGHYSAKEITFNYTSAIVTQKFFIAPFALTLTHINGVTRVAGSGGACTISFYKSASAVTVANGTLLHGGSFDLVGTADTNQPLTLVTDPNAVNFAAGDAIGYVVTGTATSAVGSITCTFESND